MKKDIDEHLKECETCKKKIDAMQMPIKISIAEPELKNNPFEKLKLYQNTLMILGVIQEYGIFIRIEKLFGRTWYMQKLSEKENIEMNDNISEQQRKELNKKLQKRTFVSEIKSRKKEKLLKFVIDFVSLFIAFCVADLIVERLQIDFWFFDMAVSIVLVMIMLFVSEIFVKKLNSKF